MLYVVLERSRYQIIIALVFMVLSQNIDRELDIKTKWDNKNLCFLSHRVKYFDYSIMLVISRMVLEIQEQNIAEVQSLRVFDSEVFKTQSIVFV